MHVVYKYVNIRGGLRRMKLLDTLKMRKAPGQNEGGRSGSGLLREQS